MNTMTRRLAHGALTAIGLAAAMSVVVAQSNTTYKLGRFSQGGRTFLGLVLNDSVAVDLSKADPSLPSEMTMLMERYDTLKSRLASIASEAATKRPAHAYDVKTLDTLPPVIPQNILNAAVNYTEHAAEMAGRSGNAVDAPTTPPPSEGIPGIWTRKPGDKRHNPYVFPKPVGSVIGDGDAIRLPPGREQVDWECELAIVIGRTADHVSPEQAKDYIFGYTLENDVSDRGGRADRRHGSDWFIGKGHSTFAPLGPYLVPKEFVPDPQKLPIKFTLSGTVMQDSTTERMTHSVYELVSFVSHVLTLRPGDIIATGSPAGVGAARGVYMKAGQTSVCSIGGIGTLTNPVEAPSHTSGE
jgi:2-keto-4-pentenoate hydratase/2-oxohepta-3-ene-1,7-dioic acid hydratase in catechol pathway